LTALCNEWSAKNNVEVKIDYITSMGEKDKLTAAEQRIARALAETEGRRRIQNEGKALLDLGDVGLDVGGDLLGAAVTLVERLQDRKGNGIIRRIGLLCGFETGQPDHVGDTVCAERGVLHR
jgi:hypothetical protein